MTSSRPAERLFAQRPKKRSRLSAEVVARIERAILLGELVAGDRLPTESELCDEFGVSRTVVREATQILAARGLIEARQGQGTIVATNRSSSLGVALAVLLIRSDLTVGDVLDARAALETQLAPLAARNATTDDIRLIEQTLDELTTAVDASDWATAEERHLAFHLTLLGALNLPALDVILRPLSEIIFISATPPQPNAPELWDLDQHRGIAEAVAAHDEHAALAAMHAHFASTEESDYTPLRRQRFREAPGSRKIIDRLDGTP
jgi:DNA-binding FadR family transcriptional regulator